MARGDAYYQQNKVTSVLIERDQVANRVRNLLTPKELRVTALISKGYKNEDIAERIHTTEQVVKNYLRSIFDKVGVSDRLELALFVVNHPQLASAAETGPAAYMLPAPSQQLPIRQPSTTQPFM